MGGEHPYNIGSRLLRCRDPQGNEKPGTKEEGRGGLTRKGWREDVEVDTIRINRRGGGDMWIHELSCVKMD